MTTITQRIDLAISGLSNGAPVPVAKVIDAVLVDGHPIGLRRDDVRLMVQLRVDGAPLLEGIAGTMQRACERAKEALLPLPCRDDLRRIAHHAHPAATPDEVDDSLEVFALHLGLEAERLAARAGMLQLELIRRRAAR